MGDPIYIGLDVGSKGIGVARASTRARLADPLFTLRRQGVKRDVQRLLAQLQREQIVAFVVGLPLTVDGEEQRSTRLARQIGEALREASETPVHFADERFSTLEARRLMTEAGFNTTQRKVARDETAAAVILQDWLDGRGRIAEE